MNKEKLASLTKYMGELVYKLESPVGSKHVNHPATYRQFLERELQAVKAKIAAAKEQGIK